MLDGDKNIDKLDDAPQESEEDSTLSESEEDDETEEESEEDSEVNSEEATESDEDEESDAETESEDEDEEDSEEEDDDSEDSGYSDDLADLPMSQYTLMQLNMASKLGKGIEFMHKKAIKARDYGKKVSPALHDLWKVAAPKNHEKYSPILDKEYQAFNENAEKFGGWGSVTKVEDLLKGMDGKS